MFFSKAYDRIKKQGFIKRDGHDDFEKYLRKTFAEKKISSTHILQTIKSEKTVSSTIYKSNIKYTELSNKSVKIEEIIVTKIDICKYYNTKEVKLNLELNMKENKHLDHEALTINSDYSVTAA